MHATCGTAATISETTMPRVDQDLDETTFNRSRVKQKFEEYPMNRRELIKSLPAGALVPAAISAAVMPSAATEKQSPGDGSGRAQTSGTKPGVYKVSNKTFDDPGAYDGIHCDQFGIGHRWQTNRG